MQLLAICSNKGGVGKTTLAVSLAAYVSNRARPCIVESNLMGAGLGLPPPLDVKRRGADLHEYLAPLPAGPNVRARDLLSSVCLNHAPPPTACATEFNLITAWIGGSGMLSEFHPKYGVLDLVKNSPGYVLARLEALLDELRIEGITHCVIDTQPGTADTTQIVLNAVNNLGGSVAFVATEDSPQSLAGLVADMDWYFREMKTLRSHSRVVFQKAKSEKWQGLSMDDLANHIVDYTRWSLEDVVLPTLAGLPPLEAVPHHQHLGDLGLQALHFDDSLFRYLRIHCLAAAFGWTEECV